MKKGAWIERKVFIGEKQEEFVIIMGGVLIMKRLPTKDWEPQFSFLANPPIPN